MQRALRFLLSWPWGYLCPCNSHFLEKSLSPHPETRLLILLYYSIHNYFVFPAISSWLKDLGTCTKDLWNRADFLYEVKWQEEHPTHKIHLVSWYLELKVRILLPLEENNNGWKTNTNPISMHIQWIWNSILAWTRKF